MTNKKAHISNTLAGGEIQACVSTYVDNHNDRITRLAALKNRAKHQENHLWSIAGFDTDSDTKAKKQSYLKPLNPLTSLVNAVTICCSKITIRLKKLN